MSDFENNLNEDEEYIENDEAEFEKVIDYEVDGSEIPVAEDSEVPVSSASSVVYNLHLSYSCENIFGAWEDDTLKSGTDVLVNTRYGKDVVKVVARVLPNTPLIRVYKIERVATEADIEKIKNNVAKENEAFTIFREKADLHKLDMKLVNVHYLFESSKILFFFTAENRVDFRELVKDLVSIFKTRIELRQIGIRDETRVLGGLGICGRNFCCNSISEKLKPVSIKMAKDQNLSLSSMKVSGACGRLLCCLSFEHNFYAEQLHLYPSEGTKIMWGGSLWRVQEVNLVSGTLRLSTEDGRLIQLTKTDFEKTDTGWTIKKKS
ncbi:MAG: regulatory iron-sulfur-containing complex subunit RicT [Termitinemataceae bacterium]|nr:MAG: regulatory iron-sulfur-containing complex subunit RicT [Termitinemataceae bacterium]